MQRSGAWRVAISAFLVGACSDPSFDLEPNGGTGGKRPVVACELGETGGGSAVCVPDCACEPPVTDTGDPHADCVARVNQFRACVCLGPLARNADAEPCADEQARYDGESGVPHSGFHAAICTPTGVAQNECHGLVSMSQALGTCLQAMFDEGPPPSSPCAGDCFQAHGHFLNLTDTRYASVACGIYVTPNGEVWQTQNYFR